MSKKRPGNIADRASERHNLSLRVMSRDLPGYRAITHDLSRTGLQLETESELSIGSTLNLDLEFDQDELPDFSCPAQVMWSEADDVRGKRFRAGLRFQPATDEQTRNLARMATVLKARSEADLEDLLEEAKRLDPERSDTFLRVVGRPTSPKSAPPECPGVFIPLLATLDSYHWVREKAGLEVTFQEGGAKHSLFFPGCCMLTDHCCGVRSELVGLFATRESEAIRRVRTRDGGSTGWKHYRFVAKCHDPVLELVSQPLEPR